MQNLLPNVDKTYKVEYPHFPAKYQAVIFRNFNNVPTCRIAKILGTTVEKIEKSAEQMGLKTPAKVNENFLKRGFITIIRDNWLLLPYSQLLTLLDITEEELAFILKEDDFLGEKLGAKPFLEEVKYYELNEEEKEKTAKIKGFIKRNFESLKNGINENCFSFVNNYNIAPITNRKVTGKTVTLNSSWGVTTDVKSDILNTYINNFLSEFESIFNLKLDGNDYFIDIVLNSNLNEEKEYFNLYIKENEIRVTAKTEVGVLRALNKILNLSTSSKVPCFNIENLEFKPRFNTRLAYSYQALYGDALLDGALSSYPDSLLRAYSKLDINAIWLQGILYTMVPFPWDKGLSKNWEKRLKGLKNLADRAEKYGIKVYLYLNEPRSMPLSFFDNYPELLGVTENGNGTLCTSQKAVQDYLYNGVKTICEAVPNIGGFFTITASENLTNCYSHTKEPDCPRCSKRNAGEVVTEVNRIIADAAHEVSEDISVVAWNWQWATLGDDFNDFARKLKGSGVKIMCTSEEAVKKQIGNVKTQVIDYSISIIGPGELAKSTWKTCKENGIETFAKVQINNTWECSTLPFLPTLNSIENHIEGITKQNVNNLMLGWTLGGYPSTMLEIIKNYYFISNDNVDTLELLFGSSKKAVEEAFSNLSDAFSNFPFHIRSLYNGPQHLGPANLLFYKKSGVNSTMTGYPFDDLDCWRADFSRELFMEQYRLLSVGFRSAFNKLKKSVSENEVREMPHIKELLDVVEGATCIYESVYNQIKFIILRDSNGSIEKIVETLNNEIECAKTMFRLQTENSTFGYESANHYFFHPVSLIEKVINCSYLIEKFSKKEI